MKKHTPTPDPAGVPAGKNPSVPADLPQPGKLWRILELFACLLTVLMPVKFASFVSAPEGGALYWGDPLSLVFIAWPLPVFMIAAGVLLFLTLLAAMFRRDLTLCRPLMKYGLFWIVLSGVSVLGFVNASCFGYAPQMIAHTMSLACYTMSLSILLSVRRDFAKALTGSLVLGGVLSLCATQNESRVWIGAHGRNSGFICDAGTLDMPKWYLIIGGYLGSSNAWGRIVNGSNVEVGRLIVSDKTPNCSLVVSNSSVNVTWGTFDVAYSAFDPAAASLPSVPTNVLVRIGGTNTSIRVFSQFRLTNDATLEFGIPTMQPMASPVIRCQAFNTTNRTFERKPTLRVTLDAEQRIGQHVTLIETTNDITDANWNNLVIDVPEGVTITREAKKIVATVASTLGTMLIIR